MTLSELQNAFRTDASLLGDYRLLTKTQLANGYCDADEAAQRARDCGDKKEEMHQEHLRSAYNSALMLRYWYKIFEWQKNSVSLRLAPEDFVEWLSKGLWVAYYYRTWRWEYEAICKNGRFIDWKLDENGEKIPNKYYWRIDENAPDKIINRCCGSIRGRYYQYYNKDKRRLDVTTFSLDSMIEDDGDAVVEETGCYSIQDQFKDEASKYLVSLLIKRSEGIEALIVDGITNRDSFKRKVYREHYMTWNESAQQEVDVMHEGHHEVFDKRRLVKHLANIDENFIDQFCKLYSIDRTTGQTIYNKLKRTSNQKLYRMIEKTLIEIKNNADMMSVILN